MKNLFFPSVRIRVDERDRTIDDLDQRKSDTRDIGFQRFVKSRLRIAILDDAAFFSGLVLIAQDDSCHRYGTVAIVPARSFAVFLWCHWHWS